MPTGARRNGSRNERVEMVFSGFPLRPTRVPRRVCSVWEADSETERREKGVPRTSKRASLRRQLERYKLHVTCLHIGMDLPGEAAGTEAGSMLVWGASDGSLAELVAWMLMQRAARGRGREVAAHVRGASARVVGGAAAGRSMAEPVNWRALIGSGGVESRT